VKLLAAFFRRTVSGSPLLLVACCCVLLPSCGPAAEVEPSDTDEPGTVSVSDEDPTVMLYFPGQDSRLYGEQRSIEPPRSDKELAAAIVTGLLSGPENRALHPPLSAEVELLNVELDTTGGTVWVDLGGDPKQIGGSKRELLAVYSFVQSLTENLDRIDKVVFLWNGIQRESFGGHVDTTGPLEADPAYLAQQ
jgi:hypothetical protein